IGLNATLTTAELPVPTATSLLLSGADTSDRTVVLRRLVRNFVALYTHWNRDGLLESYSSRCSTLGRQVRVELPGGKTVTGVAREIDSGGRLIVDGTAVASGDVIHVRPVSVVTVAMGLSILLFQVGEADTHPQLQRTQ